MLSDKKFEELTDDSGNPILDDAIVEGVTYSMVDGIGPAYSYPKLLLVKRVNGCVELLTI